MQIKNKKADIPVTILVLMIILVCVLAIFSFIYSKTLSRDSFVGTGLIETMKSFSEETSFAGSTDFSTDFGGFFKSGNVEIGLNGATIEGNYSESGFPIIGDKKKVLIHIVYQR